MWGPDIPVIPPAQALRQFLAAAGCFVAAGLFIRQFLVPERPAVPRGLPFGGLETELGGGRKVPCSSLYIDRELTPGTRRTLRTKLAKTDPYMSVEQTPSSDLTFCDITLPLGSNSLAVER
jgi:hypothetical protein